MGQLVNFLITHLKDLLFQPKDHFERVKKTSSTRLLLPLIAIVSAESIIAGILGALQSVEVQTGNFFLKVIAGSSDSFLTIAITILIAFGFYVGTNLYYTRRIKQSALELEKLDKDLRRADAYKRLKVKFNEYIQIGNIEHAYTVAALMVKGYRDEVDMDGDFLESLLTAIESPQLADIRGMLLEAPRPQKEKA